jgi:tight adherence protein B
MSPAPLVVAAASGFFGSTAGLAIGSVVAAVLIFAAIMMLTRRQGDVGARVGTFVSGGGQGKEPSLAERALGDMPDRHKVRSPLLERLALELDVAGLKLTVEQLIGLTVVLTVLAGYLFYTSLSSPLGAALALLIPFGVYYGVRFAADRERRAFDEQLPDNLQVISSAMRAGQTFVGALATVVEDAPEPSRRELKRAVTDERLGVPFDEALDRVTERMNSEDFHHVAVVANLQRETGGNTAEVVDLVADTIRERLDIKRMVRSLTAQGRLAGLMLSFLPVGMLAAMSAVDPHYVKPLFHQTPGIIALCSAGVMVLIGGLIIRKIITINV